MVGAFHQLREGRGFSQSVPVLLWCRLLSHKSYLAKPQEENGTKQNIHLWRDFPGGPVVGTPCFHYRGHGFYPSWGTRIPNAVGSGQKIKIEIEAKKKKNP